jgi:hypothetical protein
MPRPLALGVHTFKTESECFGSPSVKPGPKTKADVGLACRPLGWRPNSESRASRLASAGSSGR